MSDGFSNVHHNHQQFGTSDQFDHQFGNHSTHDVFVKDYIRKDGTLVKAHFRSGPDGDPFNNFTFPGNLNPYTGEIADGSAVQYLVNHESNFDVIMSHSDPLQHAFGYKMPYLNW